MFKIVRTYKEKMPPMRFIGFSYGDKDRNEFGLFSNKWDEWFKSGRFETLKKLEPLFEDYIGLKTKNRYWIGMFFPINTPVPQGFEYLDIPEGHIGVNWVYGSAQNDEIFGSEVYQASVKKLKEFNWIPADTICFERYNCPRFTNPDDQGNVILDYCIYLKE